MTTIDTISPDKIKDIGGFLGDRFKANLENRLKDWKLVEEFVKLHEKKNYDDWFWLGEQIGKWLDSAAYSAVISDDQEFSLEIHRILDRLEKSQEGDGYLGITGRGHRNPVRGMQLYEWYYVLHGLIECYRILESETALSIASRLSDYIVKTWGVESGQFPLAGRFPGNGHGGGEGTLILEPIVRLGIYLQNDAYIEWGEKTLQKWDEWFDKYPESVHTCGYTPMKRIAAGKIDVFEAREPIHAHTFHMTLLGVAALYDATGKKEYRDTVLGCIDHIADKWILITGGMSSGERYVPRKFHNPRNDIEVCPQHTWILLLEKALNWTGKAKYSEEIERDLFNNFLAAQIADGSNWSYMTPMNGTARNPTSPNCCNAAGTRIAGRMPTYLYGLTESGLAALIYTESCVNFNAPSGTEVSISQQTNYPSEGKIEFTVETEENTHFELKLRVPEYASFIDVSVNGKAVKSTQSDNYVSLNKEWKSNDKVEISIPMKLRVFSNERQAAIIRGPLVYTYFQDIQEEPVVFHGRRGIYPEDIELIFGPKNPEESIELTDIGKEFLGPALKVKGQISSAPVFVKESANKELGNSEKKQMLLLPFVNQGAIRGPYRTFMNYRQLTY